MTATKATDPVAVREAAFTIIPGKRPIFRPIRPTRCGWPSALRRLTGCHDVRPGSGQMECAPGAGQFEVSDLTG